MGTIYFEVCEDCTEFVDLDKFWDWENIDFPDNFLEIDKELQYFKTDFWILRSLRLHKFLKLHNGHRVKFCTIDGFDIDNYKEIIKWPGD